MSDVHPSARKHGVADADIRHARRHAMYCGEAGQDPERLLYLGPDRSGNLLEVVVIVRGDDSELAIHAMPARPKYLRLLRK